MADYVFTAPLARIISGAAGAFNTTMNYMAALAASATFFNTTPIWIPDDVDVSRPIRPYITLLSFGSPTVAGQVIVLRMKCVRFLPDDTTTAYETTFNWAPPAVWPNQTFTRLEFVNDLAPNDPIYPGGSFTPRDMIGFLVTRVAADPADNYPFTCGIFTSVPLVAHRRCQKLCC